MWQIVHYIDIDICTLTQSLPCRCLPCCLFSFSSSAYPQTDTAQLYNTHPDSCTHMDRTRLEFHFVFAKTRTIHTVILTTFMVVEPVLCGFWFIETSDLRRRYGNCERLWPPEPNLWMQKDLSRRRSMETMQSTKTFDSASEYTWASSALFLTRWWTEAKSIAFRSPWQPWALGEAHTWSVACKCIMHWPW